MNKLLGAALAIVLDATAAVAQTTTRQSTGRKDVASSPTTAVTKDGLVLTGRRRMRGSKAVCSSDKERSESPR
jgi:hypothetical protein